MKKLLLSLVALLGFTTAFAGTGTAADPYTVAEVIAKGVDASETGINVKGYIVGYANGAITKPVFSATDCTVNTNLLLADAANCSDVNLCIPIQLPKGDVRTALNLQNNPGNLGKEVTLTGDIAKYFNVPGFKNVSAYVLGEGGSTETPDTPATPSNVLLDENLENGAEGWTYDNKLLPEGLETIWSWKSYNGKYYLNASAYVSGAAYASESWAVSPEIDLTNVVKPVLSFDHAAKFQTSLKEACGFAVKVVGETEWTKLEIATWPEAGSWTFVNTSFDFIDYGGKKIQVAFIYGSTATGADTWEVKNITITDGSVDTPDTPEVPDTPETPASNVLTLLETTDAGWEYENVVLPAELTYVWSWSDSYKNFTASAFKSGAGYAADAWAVSPVIDATAATTLKFAFEHYWNYFASIDVAAEQATVAVRLEGATEWTMLTIPTLPAEQNTTFVSSGDFDLAAYAGKKFQIGLHYTSTGENVGTWRMKNMVFTADKEIKLAGETPDVPEVPVETVANIAEFLTKVAETDQPTVKINGVTSAVYQNGRYLWIKDDSGYLLVYGDNVPKYAPNAYIPEGITGLATNYSQGQFQMASPDVTTFKEAYPYPEVLPQPETITCEDLSADIVNHYVLLKDVTIAAGEKANNYTVSDATGVSITLYNQFSNAQYYDVVEVKVGSGLDVYAMVAVYKGNAQLYPVKVVGEGQTPDVPDTPDTPQGTSVTFDFTNPASLNATPALDIPAAPEAGKVTLPLNDVVFENAPISFQIGLGAREDNGGAIFFSSASAWSCRFYKKALMTVSAAEGYTMENIVFTYEKDAQSGNMAKCAFSAGAYNQETATWTGEAAELKVDGLANDGGTIAIKTMTVYYKDNAGIENVEVENAPAVYYNLQGVRMDGELVPGLYIKRQGNSASKVLVK